MIQQVILDEIQGAGEVHVEWASLVDTVAREDAGLHIAVMVEPFLGHILNGRKTVESRFSKNYIAPFQSTSVGDVVLLKAGPVVGSFRVASVTFLQIMYSSAIDAVRENYAESICAPDDDFWHDRRDKRYVTLLGIEDVCRLPPLRISKRDKRGWVVLKSGQRSRSQLSLQ